MPQEDPKEANSLYSQRLLLFLTKKANFQIHNCLHLSIVYMFIVQLQRCAAIISQHSSSGACIDLVSGWMTAPLGDKGVGSSTPLIGS